MLKQCYKGKEKNESCCVLVWSKLWQDELKELEKVFLVWPLETGKLRTKYYEILKE